jgi:Domain of unknown function (DUF4118)
MVATLPSATQPEPDIAPRDWWTRTLEVVSRARPLIAAIVSVAAPVMLTVGLLPFRAQVPTATVALGLAVLVSLLAAVGTRFTAMVAALSAAVCFDVAFAPPYGPFAISHPQDIETTALLLVGGLIVGQLSARNRRNRGLVVQTSADLASVQAIAEMMSAGAEANQVVAAVAVELQALLGLRMCWFDTSWPERPGPTIDPNGNVSWGRLWWGFDTLGLPGKEITIEVAHDQRRLGRYVLVAEAGTKVRRDQLRTAITLADQAAATLGAIPHRGSRISPSPSVGC